MPENGHKTSIHKFSFISEQSIFGFLISKAFPLSGLILKGNSGKFVIPPMNSVSIQSTTGLAGSIGVDYT